MTRARSRPRSIVVALLVALSMFLLAACDDEEPVDDVAVEDEAAETMPAEEDEEAGVLAEDPTVVDDEFFEDPRSFVDEQVTVEGVVAEVLGKNAFMLEDGDGSGHEIVVIYLPNDDGVDQGSTVLVTGVVRNDDAETVADELGADVSDVENEIPGVVIAASSADTEEQT